jgi:uncharacterized protein YqjF (DUF2071 family)
MSGPVRRALEEVAHRPWPLPGREWTWRQSWLDLLFAHWPIAASAIRPLVPRELQVQEFDGTSWIGVVPFRMAGVTRRPLPELPWLSAFPELNVRVYVQCDGQPGVWFLSLDASNPLAVWAARRFFYLPYHRAAMSITEKDGVFHYSAQRSGAEFEASYRPTSDVYRSLPGSLEHWLTERYCLYASSPKGVLVRNHVHHLLWLLQRAEATFTRNTMLKAHGLSIPTSAPVLHFAKRLDVAVWNAERVMT